MKNRWLGWFVMCGWFVAPAVDATTLNYQGRITAHGTNFTGIGHFKFVLLDAWENGLWSNDGTPGAGEPASAVTIEVNNGLFNVELGASMFPIPAIVFHADELKLRTWFSHNGVVFEQLMPDVPIARLDFGRLDTGGTIIVDSSGRGDFEDLQQAINHFAQYGGNGILVMPGYYELAAPLTFPPTNGLGQPVDYPIGGLGDRWRVWIENPSGPAVQAGPFRLENMTLVGDPALKDEIGASAYWFGARNCTFLRNTAGGPAVELQNEGMALFERCEMQNHEGGDVLWLGGDTEVQAQDCGFYAWSDSGNALALDGHRRLVRVRRCDFYGQGDGGRSLHIVNSSEASADFVGCFLERGVRIENRAMGGGGYGARFVNCEISGGVEVTTGDPGVELDQCRVDGRESGVPAVELVGLQPGARVWLRNCFLLAEEAPALQVWDAAGDIIVKGSEVKAQESAAIRMVADPYLLPGWGVRATLQNCRVANHGEGVSNKNTVVLENDVPQEPWRVSLSLVQSQIENGGHGIACSNAAVRLVWSGVRSSRSGISGVNSMVDMAWSRIEADEDGIYMTNGAVDVAWSSIEGGRHGIVALGGCEVNAERSSIEAGDEEDNASGDGIHFVRTSETEGGLEVLSCNIGAYGNDPAQSRGVFAFYTNATGFNLVTKSVIGASGAAMQLNGGEYVLEDNFLHSGAGPVVLLMHSNTTASLTGCHLYGMSEGNTNAALVLYATPGKMGPQPRVWNATMQTYAPPYNARYAISVSGGTSTGRVGLVNSILSTNINPVVAIIPARTNLINGNIIP